MIEFERPSIPVRPSICYPENVLVFFNPRFNLYTKDCIDGYLEPSNYMGLLRQFLAESINMSYEKSIEYNIDIDELFRAYMEARLLLGDTESINRIIFSNLFEIAGLQGRYVPWKIDEESEKAHFNYTGKPRIVEEICTKEKYDYVEAFRLTVEEILSMEERMLKEQEEVERGTSKPFVNRPITDKANS